MVKGGIKQSKGQSHKRAQSDTYTYNFNHQDVFYSGSNTLDDRAQKLNPKIKQNTKKKIIDKKDIIHSPRFNINSTKGSFNS